MVRLAGGKRVVALAVAAALGGVFWAMRPHGGPTMAPARPAPDRRPGSVGGSPGARMVRGVVAGRSVDVWMLRFAPGAPGRVRVTGEEGRPLACLVEDAGGARQDSAGGSGECLLRWTAGLGENYRVLIRNPDETPTAYRLLVE
ncbi:MAG TPA: hypothetical protein VF705_09630 [Longimicrobium sp.]